MCYFKLWYDGDEIQWDRKFREKSRFREKGYACSLKHVKQACGPPKHNCPAENWQYTSGVKEQDRNFLSQVAFSLRNNLSQGFGLNWFLNTVCRVRQGRGRSNSGVLFETTSQALPDMQESLPNKLHLSVYLRGGKRAGSILCSSGRKECKIPNDFLLSFGTG